MIGIPVSEKPFGASAGFPFQTAAEAAVFFCGKMEGDWFGELRLYAQFVLLPCCAVLMILPRAFLFCAAQQSGRGGSEEYRCPCGAEAYSHIFRLQLGRGLYGRGKPGGMT